MSSPGISDSGSEKDANDHKNLLRDYNQKTFNPNTTNWVSSYNQAYFKPSIFSSTSLPLPKASRYERRMEQLRRMLQD